LAMSASGSKPALGPRQGVNLALRPTVVIVS